MAAASRAPQDIPSDDDVPEGWELVSNVKKNGTPIKYFTNCVGQRFYNKPDLMRNIRDAKKRGLSIYAPDFQPPSPRSKRNSQKANAEAALAHFRSRIEPALSSNKKQEKYASKNKGRRRYWDSHCEVSSVRKEVVDENEIECASALIDLSVDREDVVRRARDMIKIAEAQVYDTFEPRTSRRLAGLDPELHHDFICSKPLEYVLKDKPGQLSDSGK